MPQGIDYFNRGHWLSKLQARVSLDARRRMFELWRSRAGALAGTSLLDIGATPDLERLDSNCMLPWFQESGLRLSVYSPEDVSHLERSLPGVSILPPAAGPRIPASDASFDWVSSSAVIEHVGSSADQEAFLRESGRVARRGLFVTCPNRWHWLEFHTKLPLLHWLPRAWHRAVLSGLGLEAWARESHLRLLGPRELGHLARRALGPQWEWKVHSIWTLALPSNLVLVATRKT
jgi:Methyltransferase domain